MTVGELIKQLQELDPDLHVFTQGYEGGYDNVYVGEEREIALNVHEEWYYGKHEEANNEYYVKDKSKYTVVKGITL